MVLVMPRVLSTSDLVLYVRLRSLSARWGAPGSSLPATVHLVSAYWKHSLLSAQHTGDISICMMLHVSLAAALALCVYHTPPALHQGLPCMGSKFNPFP